MLSSHQVQGSTSILPLFSPFDWSLNQVRVSRRKRMHSHIVIIQWRRNRRAIYKNITKAKGNHKKCAESRDSKNTYVTTLSVKGGRDDGIVWIQKSWKWEEVSFHWGIYSQFNIIQQERSQETILWLHSSLHFDLHMGSQDQESLTDYSHTLYLSWWRKMDWNRRGKYKISSIVLNHPSKYTDLYFYLFCCLP